MKATDLRIGNTIQRLFEGEFVSIEDCTIRTLYDIFQVDSGMTSHFQFEPIPLTKEWLLKIDWNGYIYLHFNSYFSMDVSGHIYYRSDYTGINVTYLHELQNLYFALTGEELTLKP